MKNEMIPSYFVRSFRRFDLPLAVVLLGVTVSIVALFFLNFFSWLFEVAERLVEE
jgi:uncharacterized membrane protein YoaT (DUF817 family)